MNIERRPVKAVKVTVYTLLVILCWLAIGFVELDSIKYLACCDINLFPILRSFMMRQTLR